MVSISIIIRTTSSCQPPIIKWLRSVTVRVRAAVQKFLCVHDSLCTSFFVYMFLCVKALLYESILHRKLRIKVFPAGFPAGPQPQRISEDIPDRMSENMSKTCHLVGITRRKYLLFVHIESYMFGFTLFFSFFQFMKSCIFRFAFFNLFSVHIRSFIFRFHLFIFLDI